MVKSVILMFAVLLATCYAQQSFLNEQVPVSDARLEKKKKFSLDDFVPEHPLADNSTYGNIEEIHTTHFHLDWDIDFEHSEIRGTITHDLSIVSSCRVLQFDAWDIDVVAVRKVQTGSAQLMKSFGTDVAETRKLYDLGNAQVELDYRVDTFNALIGQTLLIDLGETMEAGQQISIAVEYQTRKNGTAFSWLTAA